MKAPKLVALILLYCCSPAWGQIHSPQPEVQPGPNGWPSDWPEWLITMVDGITSKNENAITVNPTKCILVSEVAKQLEPRALIDLKKFELIRDERGLQAAETYISSITSLPEFAEDALLKLKNYGRLCSLVSENVEWPKDERGQDISGLDGDELQELAAERKIHLLVHSGEIYRIAHSALDERSWQRHMKLISDYNNLVERYNDLRDRHTASVEESEHIFNLYEVAIQAYQSRQRESSFWTLLERLGNAVSSYSNSLQSYRLPPKPRSLYCTTQTYDTGFTSLGIRGSIRCSEE